MIDMYVLLNIFFTLCHILLIGFNLLGWIWIKTRKWHLLSILATAASWFLLGIWYGIGYCPLTEWHWEVKRNLGESDLPNSFIKYALDHLFNTNMNASVVDAITAGAFAIVLIISIYLNWIKKKNKRK